MSDINILLAEDNPGDIHLIEQTFEERSLQGTLHTVRTGDAALDWLYQRNEFTEARRPDIVLLDLNLPATGGQTVLKEIKSDPQLKSIPVIILTGSESERELLEAYMEYANACLTKPPDWEALADLIEAFAEFWVSTAALPSIHDSAVDTHR